MNIKNVKDKELIIQAGLSAAACLFIKLKKNLYIDLNCVFLCPEKDMPENIKRIRLK